jgi:hypothetical protein
MPFACVSGRTKSCDKNQNVPRIQLKPNPTIVRPSSATHSSAARSAWQNFGNAVDGGAAAARRGGGAIRSPPGSRRARLPPDPQAVPDGS